MNYLYKFGLIVLIHCLLTGMNTSFAKTTHGTSNGNWNSSGTWDNGIPSCGDSVFVDKDITVTVSDHVNLEESSSPACSSAVIIIINGTLKFNNGKKLHLSCPSRVFVTEDGELKKGGGGGNSNLIEICETTVWNAGDGDQSGPIPIGPGLPITLEYFRVSKEGDIVRLKWATQSETNNDYFSIERSTDLKNNEIIQTIEGAGTSRQRLEYETTDFSPINGDSYYRLKQTDYNGVYAHSSWASVNMKGKIRSVSLMNTVDPNEIYLQCNGFDGRTASIILSDSYGRIVKEESRTITGDSYVWNLPMSELTTDGMYIVRFQSGSTDESLKFLRKQ